MMGNQRVCGFHLFLQSVFLVATTYTCMGAQNSSCQEQERRALLEFKHSVQDDFKVLSSWVGPDCCSWKGVRCDGATGSVVRLNLRGNYNGLFNNYLESDFYLVGNTVNAYLAELRHLKHLDLSGNNFQGNKIPEFIGSFEKLSYLNLSESGFTGIPHHIGNLSNLKVLDLSSSKFRFMLKSNDMSWVSSLSSLKHLDLSAVDLRQAKNIDMVLNMVFSLRYLSLSDCGLFNADLVFHLNSSKTLPNIKHLDLSFNFFDGQLPLFFQNLTSLTFLDLSFYSFGLEWNTVNLLNMIPSLSELHLSWCGLHSAPFSPTFLNSSVHSNIQYLDLSFNSFVGRFPSELMNMTSLRVLDLSFNILNSSIPVMPNLIKLDVSGNKFAHIELAGIWRQCQLKELSLSGNPTLRGEMLGPSTDPPECSQYALETLQIDGSQLHGLVPEFIGRLNNLRLLSLKGNSFTGSIPKALERLSSLEVLDLRYNDLSGPIPTFLGKLTQLYLSGNQFSRSIPESLGTLTGLTDLKLDSNQLTGPLPISLGKLALLRTFSVSSNWLNGTIPFSVRQLSKLAYLDVSNNSLEGVVLEAHFANLTMLKFLDLTSNHKLIFKISHEWIPPFQLRSVRLGSCKIADEFPQWLQTQIKLEALDLSNASLYGILPTWLQKMSAISYLDLSHNKLSGSLKNLPSRSCINRIEGEKYILLQDNLFNGSIPRLMCKKTCLAVLDVSRNRLTGNIPDCIENLKYIRWLMLSSNELSGVLPTSLGNISSSLSWLKLNDNKFSGEIPQDIRKLRYIRVLDMGNNKFSGNIPKWIGENLTYLMVLRLHKNNFTGRIPWSLCKCSHLQILDVAHNNLTGSIPPCFGMLNGMIEANQLDIHNGSMYIIYAEVIQVLKGKDLEYTRTLGLVYNMDLSSNKLTGEIPTEISALALLVGLNLSHNHLSGSIPDNIGNIKALNSLDLSDNQFTGAIPPSMAALNFLSYMNLSYNNLSGRIPTGNQLQTLTDPSIYAGNRDLCGAPLPNDCSRHEVPTTTTTKNKYKETDEAEEWFYLSVICGLATGFWGVIGVLVFKKQWRYKFFTFSDVITDTIWVAVMVRVSKIKRKGRYAM